MKRYKNLGSLVKFIDRVQDNIVKQVVEIQRETADSICKDAKSFAPGKGPYRDTIKVGETEINGTLISTKITTDMTVEAKSNRNIYNLGYLLENGTLEHAIPNAFGLGNFYGYVDRYGYRHKGTLDKDWHPGFRPFPHFIPALLLNKEEYNRKINKMLKKEFK